MNRVPGFNCTTDNPVGLLQSSSKPHCTELQADSLFESTDNKDTSPNSSRDRLTTCDDCVYTSVSLSTDISNVCQLKSDNIQTAVVDNVTQQRSDRISQLNSTDSSDIQTAIVDRISQLKSTDSSDIHTAIVDRISQLKSTDSSDIHTAIVDRISQLNSTDSSDIQTAIVDRISQLKSTDSCDIQTAIVDRISQLKSTDSCDIQTAIVDRISQLKSTDSSDIQTAIVDRISQLKSTDSSDIQTAIVDRISQLKSTDSCDIQTAIVDRISQLKSTDSSDIQTAIVDRISQLKSTDSSDIQTAIVDRISQLKSTDSSDIQTAIVDRISQLKSTDSGDIQTAIVDRISQLKSTDSGDIQTAIVDRISQLKSTDSCDIQTAIVDRISQLKSTDSCDIQTAIVDRISQLKSTDSCDIQTAIVDRISQLKSTDSCDIQTAIVDRISQLKSTDSCDIQTAIVDRISLLKSTDSSDIQTAIVDRISLLKSTDSSDIQTAIVDRISQLKSTDSSDIQTAIVDRISQLKATDSCDIQTAIVDRISQLKATDSSDIQTAIVDRISQLKSTDSSDIQTAIGDRISQLKSTDSSDIQTAIVDRISQLKSTDSCDIQTAIVDRISQLKSTDSCDIQTAIVDRISQLKSTDSCDIQTAIVDRISQLKSTDSCDIQTAIVDRTSQLKSTDSSDIQTGGVYHYSGDSSSAPSPTLQVTSTTLSIPLVSSGIQELNWSEQIVQEVLPQGYRLITSDGVQYVPISRFSVSGLPLEASTTVLGSEAYCQNITVPSVESVNQLDVIPTDASYSQHDVSNGAFSQLSAIPSVSSQQCVTLIASLSRQDMVPSGVTFSPQDAVFNLGAPERQNRLLELETMTSVGSSRSEREASLDILSYSCMSRISEMVPQTESVPAKFLQNAQVTLTEPSVSASWSSSEMISPVDDPTMQDSLYLNVNSADSIGENFTFSVCENASAICPETTTIESSLNAHSVFLGNTTLDSSFTELMTRPDNPAVDYFDICKFMSSPETSPVKTRTATTHSTPSPPQLSKDNDFRLSKIKNDHPKDLMPKKVVSPSRTKVFISPNVAAGKPEGIKIKKTKPRLKAVKPGTGNCHYVKPISRFLSKTKAKMVGTLKPFCKCVEEPDHSLVMKEQTLFTSGQQVLLPQICRIACCAFELIAVRRSGVVFMCTKQLFTFGLIDEVFYNTVQKCHPQHVDHMTRDEIVFVEQHTGMSDCHGLVSLEFIAAALTNLPVERKQAVGSDLTFYQVRPGHWCNKRKKLIRTLSDLERKKNKTFYKPMLDCSSAKKLTAFQPQRKKCAKEEAEMNSKFFVVTRPDGNGCCLGEVKKIIVANKELLSFYCLGHTYVNCQQLCQHLADFPWESFLELAKSLNIDFIDAPEEVQTYLENKGHSKDILSGKWTSIANLRLISCFAVGQMNHTDFLIKNSILTKIARGDFEEVLESPKTKVSVSGSTNVLSECKGKKVVPVRKSSKKSFKNELHAKDAKQPASRTKKVRNTKVKKTKTKKISSEMSTKQHNSPSLKGFDMPLNSSGDEKKVCVNKGDCVKTTDGNANVVFVQNEEGSLLECTPLFLKENPQEANLSIVSSTAPDTPLMKSVSSTETATKPSLSPVKRTQSSSSPQSGRRLGQMDGSPPVYLGSDHVSCSLDLSITIPKAVTDTSDDESMSPSSKGTVASPKKVEPVSQTREDLTSPDSGISQDIKSGSSPTCSALVEQEVERWMASSAYQMQPGSVGSEPVDQTSCLQQSPKLTTEQSVGAASGRGPSGGGPSGRGPSKRMLLETVGFEERLGKCQIKSGQSEMSLDRVTGTGGGLGSEDGTVNHAENSFERDHHGMTAENMTDAEKSNQQVIPYFKCQDVVTAFKQLLPMISVTEVVNKQNQCKFHLRLGQPIKQMLINGEQSVANVHLFLKIIGRLVKRAQQFSGSRTASNSSRLATVSASTVDTSSPGNLVPSGVLHSCFRPIAAPSGGGERPQLNTASQTPHTGSKQTPSKYQMVKESRKILVMSSAGNRQLFRVGGRTCSDEVGRSSTTTDDRRVGPAIIPGADLHETTAVGNKQQMNRAKMSQNCLSEEPTITSAQHVLSVKNVYSADSASVQNVTNKLRTTRSMVPNCGGSEKLELKVKRLSKKTRTAKLKREDKKDNLLVSQTETVPEFSQIKRKKGRPKKNVNLKQCTVVNLSALSAPVHGKNVAMTYSGSGGSAPVHGKNVAMTYSGSGGSAPVHGKNVAMTYSGSAAVHGKNVAMTYSGSGSSAAGHGKNVAMTYSDSAAVHGKNVAMTYSGSAAVHGKNVAMTYSDSAPVHGKNVAMTYSDSAAVHGKNVAMTYSGSAPVHGKNVAMTYSDSAPVHGKNVAMTYSGSGSSAPVHGKNVAMTYSGSGSSAAVHGKNVAMTYSDSAAVHGKNVAMTYSGSAAVHGKNVAMTYSDSAAVHGKNVAMTYSDSGSSAAVEALVVDWTSTGISHVSDFVTYPDPRLTTAQLDDGPHATNVTSAAQVFVPPAVRQQRRQNDQSLAYYEQPVFADFGHRLSSTAESCNTKTRQRLRKKRKCLAENYTEEGLIKRRKL